jgi:hypothetical protein
MQKLFRIYKILKGSTIYKFKNFRILTAFGLFPLKKILIPANKDGRAATAPA